MDSYIHTESAFLPQGLHFNSFFQAPRQLPYDDFCSTSESHSAGNATMNQNHIHLGEPINQYFSQIPAPSSTEQLNCESTSEEWRSHTENSTQQLSETPILKHHRMPQVHLLAGDFLVDLNVRPHFDLVYCSFSALNYFKNISQIEFVKSCNSCEIHLTATSPSSVDFSDIVSALESSSDKPMSDLSVLLKQHQINVSLQQQKALSFQNNEDFINQIIPLQHKKYERFLEESHQFLKKQAKQFHIYYIYKPNTLTLLPELIRIGFSNGLASLLCGSTEHLSWLLMHHGLFDFTSRSSLNKIQVEILQMLQNSGNNTAQTQQASGPITLVTLDGIEMSTRYTMTNYFGEQSDNNVLFSYPNMMVVTSFDIPVLVQRKVQSVREQKAGQKNLFAHGDAKYQAASQQFLETHYAERVKKIRRKNSRDEELGSLAVVVPKQKRKYNKHPKTKYQIDFRKHNGILQSMLKRGQKVINRRSTDSTVLFDAHYTNTNSLEIEQSNPTLSPTLQQ